jgi:hypothetical protein
MKKMSAANSTQSAKRGPEILMIASDENSATSLAKTSNALTVPDAETVSRINGKQPEFIELSFIEYA